MLTRKVDFKFGLTSSASEENRRASLESGDLTIISVNFGSFKFGNVVDDERLLLSPTPSLSPPPAAMLIIISQTLMCLLGSRIQSGLRHCYLTAILPGNATLTLPVRAQLVARR